MPCFKRLDLRVDVSELREQLKAHPELFGQYPMRGNFQGSPHREMTDIWVRYNDVTPFLESGDFSKFGDEHDSVWYPCAQLIPAVRPVVFSIMAAVQGERLGGVLITKLPPGGKIHPHTDSGWHARYYDKFYVPVEDYGSVFGFEDGDIHPEPGEVYWFDNSRRHWVVNDADGERVSMIVCIKTGGH